MSRCLPAGTTIHGYRIDRVLSDQGSFSVVYLAYDTDQARVARRSEKVAGRLERWRSRYGPAAAATPLDPGPFVALKEYIPNLYAVRRGTAVAAASGEADIFAWGRERFVRESHFLSDHSHPNVVAVYDILSAHNTEYYVMERLTGGSLAEALARDGTQTEAQVRGWLLPTLNGLASVERRDANHLDLAPGNIMFRIPGGDPVLVDFGASRIGGSPPIHSSRLVINDNFAAPEKYKLTSSKLSSPADVYSLAGIANYALGGDVPAAANERLAGMASFTDSASARRRRNASPPFLNVVDHAFSLNVQERFSDARAFSEALQATGRQFKAPPAHSPNHVRLNPVPGTRSDRTLLILACVSALLIVLIAVTLINFVK